MIQAAIQVCSRVRRQHGSWLKTRNKDVLARHQQRQRGDTSCHSHKSGWPNPNNYYYIIALSSIIEKRC